MKTFVSSYGRVSAFTAQRDANGSDQARPVSLEAIDISGYDSMRVDFEKPNGLIVSFTHATNASVELVSDGTDGRFSFAIPEDTLDTAGAWKVQGRVVIDAMLHWKSDIIEFEVYEALA